jgi:hypothetical protein
MCGRPPFIPTGVPAGLSKAEIEKWRPIIKATNIDIA